MPTRQQINRRVIITLYGGPEVLHVIEEDLPEPQKGQARVQILAAGVSYADLLMREGVHPEAWFRRPPFTPGWDIVGVVDKIGANVSGVKTGQVVFSLPIVGGYANYLCLPEKELVPVPAGLDPVEMVGLGMNYITAYQMMHRSAHAAHSERALIHNAAGGVGTALMQLGKLINLEMYGTASAGKHSLVSRYGGSPIDYKALDFVSEIFKRSGDGVDIVFDGIGGKHLQRSYKTLRSGGRLVAYGLTSMLSNGRRIPSPVVTALEDWIAAFALNLRSTKRRVMLYSIQTLKRQKPIWFFEDLAVLMKLLEQKKIEPVVAEQIPLAQARRAHELIASGSVAGKIVLTTTAG